MLSFLVSVVVCLVSSGVMMVVVANSVLYGFPTPAVIFSVQMSPSVPLAISFYPPRLSGVVPALFDDRNITYHVSINDIQLNDQCIAQIITVPTTSAPNNNIYPNIILPQARILTIDASLAGCDWVSSTLPLTKSNTTSPSGGSPSSISVMLTSQNLVGSTPALWQGQPEQTTSTVSASATVQSDDDDTVPLLDTPSAASSSSSSSSALVVSVVVPIALLFVGLGAGYGGLVVCQKYKLCNKSRTQTNLPETVTTAAVVGDGGNETV